MIGLVTVHITGIAIIAAIVFLFVSDSLYRTVVARAKPLFPANLQDTDKASFSLGAFMWEANFPNELRRKYLWSIGFATLAGACVTLTAYKTGHLYWAVFFSGLLIFVAGLGITRWTKYRSCL